MCTFNLLAPGGTSYSNVPLQSLCTCHTRPCSTSRIYSYNLPWPVWPLCGIRGHNTSEYIHQDHNWSCYTGDHACLASQDPRCIHNNRATLADTPDRISRVSSVSCLQAWAFCLSCWVSPSWRHQTCPSETLLPHGNWPLYASRSWRNMTRILHDIYITTSCSPWLPATNQHRYYYYYFYFIFFVTSQLSFGSFQHLVAHFLIKIWPIRNNCRKVYTADFFVLVEFSLHLYS